MTSHVCGEDRPETVWQLLDARANVNEKDSQDWTTLYACCSGKLDIVRILLVRGVYVYTLLEV